MVAAGLVWTIGPNGILYGLNPSPGRRNNRRPSAPGQPLPDPSVGDGFFLVPTSDRVVAFAASSTAVSTTTSSTTAATSTTTARTTTTVPAGQQGTSPWVFAGAVLAGLVAIGALSWYVRRKTGRRSHRVGPGLARIVSAAESSTSSTVPAPATTSEMDTMTAMAWRSGPVHRLPLADVVELVEGTAVDLFPAGFLGRPLPERGSARGRRDSR